MGLIGSLISGVTNLGSTLVGGIANRKAYNDVKGNLDAQEQDNQNWYDRRYNEDATQRADAQRLLTMTEESIKNRNRQAAGTAATMGGTEESVAAAKAAGNQAIADTASQINAQADARKDNIENTYNENKVRTDNAINALTQQKAANTAAAVQSAGKAAGDIANIDF